MAEAELTKFRSLTGPVALWEKCLQAAIPVSGLVFVSDAPFYLGLAILREQYLGLFLALILGGVFLSVPPSSRADLHRVPWYDLLFSFLGLAVGLYAAIFSLKSWSAWVNRTLSGYSSGVWPSFSFSRRCAEPWAGYWFS
jgi:TRAP-type uncharacterized transport system fused permease subunit